MLKYLEKVVQQHWPTPPEVIALISLGYLEEDGVSISLLTAVVVLALDLGLVWEVLHGAKTIRLSV